MFQIEQTYDLKGLTLLCRAARKAAKPWMHILRCVLWVVIVIVIALNLLLLSWGDTSMAWSLLLYTAFLALLLTQDRLCALIARRNLLPGSAHSVTVFASDSYTVTTDTTETIFHYENITDLYETEGYFIFLLGKRHGQLFDKNGFQAGTVDGFRIFLEEKTEKAFRKIK